MTRPSRYAHPSTRPPLHHFAVGSLRVERAYLWAPATVVLTESVASVSQADGVSSAPTSGPYEHDSMVSSSVVVGNLNVPSTKYVLLNESFLGNKAELHSLRHSLSLNVSWSVASQAESATIFNLIGLMPLAADSVCNVAEPDPCKVTSTRCARRPPAHTHNI